MALVEGLAGGGEGAPGVGQDPVHPGGDPGVHTGEARNATALAPADHTNLDRESLILGKYA